METRIKYFNTIDEADAWAERRFDRGLTTANVVKFVDCYGAIIIGFTTYCQRGETAVNRMFRTIGEDNRLWGIQDSMLDMVRRGDSLFDHQEDLGVCYSVGQVRAGEWHVYVRLEKDFALLQDIANEFATQQKYDNENYAREHHHINNDCLVQYIYDYVDADVEDRQYRAEIYLSVACAAAGVEFDRVDEDDIEERVIDELKYFDLIPDDVEGIDDIEFDDYDRWGDSAKEAELKTVAEEIRTRLWKKAYEECSRARDELCLHERLDAGWFLELCQETAEAVRAAKINRD